MNWLQKWALAQSPDNDCMNAKGRRGIYPPPQACNSHRSVIRPTGEQEGAKPTACIPIAYSRGDIYYYRVKQLFSIVENEHITVQIAPEIRQFKAKNVSLHG